MALKKVGLQAVFETAEFQRGIVIYNQGVVNVNNAGKKAAQQSKQSSQTVQQAWTKGFAAVAAAATTVIAAYKAVTAATQKVGEATRLAARVETLGVAMEAVGQIAGAGAEQMRGYEKAIKEKGITTQAARQSLLMMAQAEIEFARGADLARAAQDAAVIANTNSSEAFERMIYGIQSANVRVLRTVGINVSWQRSYEKLAAQLGKTTDDLTEQEQVQARVNAVMEASTRISGTYEAALGTVGKQAASLARHQEESMLILGNVFKESWGIIIQAQTEAWKGFREWAEENEEELGELGKAFTQLTATVVNLAESVLGLNETNLTQFVASLTEALETLSQIVAMTHASAAAFQEFAEAVTGGIRVRDPLSGLYALMRTGLSDQESRTKAATKAQDKYNDVIGTYLDKWEEAETKTKPKPEAPTPLAPEVEPADYTEAAEVLTSHLDKLQKLQRDHYRRMAEMQADQERQRVRDIWKQAKALEKARQAGQEKLEDITAKHEKARAKLLKDAEKSIAKVEAEAQKDRLRQQQDFERQERQQRERAQLDKLQSERRYQFQWARALAEGDALALYYMQQERELEKQEAKENEALRRKQTQESQANQVRETGEAAREQIEEMRQQLAEQLREQDQGYQEQIEKQKQANIERLIEMAVNFAEQQALRDEDNALAAQKQKENYRRQLEDLGASLADQEAVRELGAENAERMLDQYYSEGGTSDAVMEGWHERERTRIEITNEMMQGLTDNAAVMAEAVEESTARAAQAAAASYRVAGAGGMGGIPMQHGGILRGPATAYIEPGMVEAFIPLGRMGGTMNVTGNIGVGVTGLERAMPALVNQVASQVGTRVLKDLTSEIRTRRQAR